VEELSVTRVPVTGTWLRHVPAGSDPLYRPPTPADGRWQRGANVEGIYLAAEEATVWAEWYRWLAELEIEPLHGLPRELWRYRASLSSVADLTRAETLDAFGLPNAEPTRDQWPAFQDVGERLHAAGCDGLLYHSAARPDGLCLCVFRTHAEETRSRLEPIERPRRVDRPPTPPRGLRT
jgi:RES domain-containing protein